MVEEKLLDKDAGPREMGCRSDVLGAGGSIEDEHGDTWTTLLSGELLLGERDSAMRSSGFF